MVRPGSDEVELSVTKCRSATPNFSFHLLSIGAFPQPYSSLIAPISSNPHRLHWFPCSPLSLSPSLSSKNPKLIPILMRCLASFLSFSLPSVIPQDGAGKTHQSKSSPRGKCFSISTLMTVKGNIQLRMPFLTPGGHFHTQ